MKKIMICIAAMAMSALSMSAQEVKSVTVNNKGQNVDVAYNDGGSKKFTERNSNSLSFEENLSIVNGTRKAYNVKHTGLDGKARKRTTLYGLGGIALVNKSVAPQVTAGISHSLWPSIDLGLQAEYSRAKYDDEAIAEGGYDTFSFFATAEMTVLQSNAAAYTADGSKLMLGLAAGAAFQKTDDLSVEKIPGSSGYGFAGKVFAKGQINIATNAYLLVEGGIKMLPQFDLDKLKTGEEKLMENIAPYVQAGIAIKF